jgi:histidine ammonia-lyase
VRSTLSVELNSATDNPLINTDTGEIVSNGNFHGQPVAFAMDILSMALCELGSLSERRSAKLIDPGFSELPAFLVKNEGLNSGYMIAHVTAAALVSENRVLSHPASTDSIPTNNEKEDHVSMGPFAARKAQMILRNAQYILAIESLLGAQALDFRLPLKSGKGPQFLWKFIRAEIPALARDRVLSPDIEWMMQQIQTGGLYLEAKKAGLW